MVDVVINQCCQKRLLCEELIRKQVRYLRKIFSAKTPASAMFFCLGSEGAVLCWTALDKFDRSAD